MRTYGKTLTGWLLGLFSLLAVTSACAETVTARHSGVVVAVDKAAGTIVLGDMGPKPKSGGSKLTHYTTTLTPSTAFVRVRRGAGTAPSGWVGDYVETKLQAWDIKPGDWVTVGVEAGKQRMTAVTVTVVDTTEP